MTATFAVDLSRTCGRLRPLHGGNNGPLYHGGIVDLTPQHRRLRIPLVRLHDCDWPGDYLVDIHAIFPDPEADPDDPSSYDFANTDDYIARIIALGSRIVYRLGCRIEHTRRRLHTAPPADPARWARICLGIIRHFNEGWADGYRWNIRHWEIWNEPDIPPGCWSGTWDDYFRLYAAAAGAIKAAWPDLLVGGPAYAIGSASTKQGVEYAFARSFIAFCRDNHLPLDFFSWHTYAPGDLTVWAVRAHAFRTLLDEHGFTATESHLNEWHVLPTAGSSGPAWHFAETMQGPVGASAIAATLTYLQDLPIDEACLYTMDPAALYGMFTLGNRPQPSYHAVAAFADLLRTPLRCAASGGDAAAGLSILAGQAEDRSGAQILLANFVHCPQVRFPLRLAGLPWSGPTAMSIRRLDAEHELSESERQILPAGDAVVDIGMPSASVLLIALAPAPTGALPGARREIDGPAPLRIGRPALTLVDGRPALAVPVCNHGPEGRDATLVATCSPDWLDAAPAWSGRLPAGGDGRSVCVLPLACAAPGDDPTLRLALSCAGRSWAIPANLDLVRSGATLVLDGWAALTPRIDGDGVHLHGEISDESLHDHRDLGGPDRAPHRGACIELFCDWDRAGDLDRPGYDGDDMQFICTPPSRDGGTPVLRVLGPRPFATADLAYNAHRTGSGWSLDLSIPWRCIAAAGGRPDLPIALALAARAYGADGRECRIARWAGGDGASCDTSGFGLLVT